MPLGDHLNIPHLEKKEKIPMMAVQRLVDEHLAIVFPDHLRVFTDGSVNIPRTPWLPLQLLVLHRVSRASSPLFRRLGMACAFTQER